MTDVYRIEFHSPLFHAGKNFGNKIEVHKVQGLSVGYDGKNKLFQINYLGRKAMVSEASVYLWEFTPETPVKEVVNEHATSDVGKFKTAQVSSPMGHVFEGPGKGKTR